MTNDWNALVEANKHAGWTAPPQVPKNRITRVDIQVAEVPSPNANDQSQDYYAQCASYALAGEFINTPEHGWLHWNGHRWEEDKTNAHLAEIRTGLRTLLPSQTGANNSSHRKNFTASYVKGVAEMVGWDQRIARSITEFDTDRYLLNTPSGPVDLVTGEIHEPDSSVLVTKSTTVTPVFGKSAPMFERLLATTFAGDKDTSDYLLAGAGLSLIGSQDHQVFFMLNGVGGSGKGTVMNIFQSLLGTEDHGYAVSIEASTFTTGHREGHPTEVARLRGKRLVVGSEITEAVALDTAKLKNLTGGDKLTGRFMRQDFFTFDATHTLWIMTNYRPRVSESDSGFWRRLREIPFLHKPETVVEGLAERIVEEEGPAVLGMMIEAAVRYLSDGLSVPESVRAANSDNRIEQDSVVQFIDECVDIESNGFVTNMALYEAYEIWCRRSKYQPLSPRKLGDSVHNLGYIRTKKNNTRGHQGITLPPAFVQTY